MKINVGDHVELKGLGLTGLSGTVVRKGLMGNLHIRLDPGQTRLGNSAFYVSRMNVARVLDA